MSHKRIYVVKLMYIDNKSYIYRLLFYYTTLIEFSQYISKRGCWFRMQLTVIKGKCVKQFG